ncbi:hypothetical protein IAT38_004239 [Cryptococcus sp. DSM 104549]
MSDATKYGNPLDFIIDLHSIYAAYLGSFEADNIDWWEKSWGGFFVSFNAFLTFGWEVMVVVDSVTGKPHIAVRPDQIALFAKMIRTRFGETLSKDPPTMLPLRPVATRTLSLRRLLPIRDLTAYRKLAQTLPSAALSYLRSRVRAGEPAVAEQLFYAGGAPGDRETGGVGVRDNGVGYTFACVKTNWWERGGPAYGLVLGTGRTQPRNGHGPQGNKGLVLEVGMAVLRCANLRAVNVWPPVAEENYRKSHYIVEEWVYKRTNSNPPTYPRAYAFGKSDYVAENRIETILDATLGSLATQDDEGHANTLVLLTVGDPAPLPVPSSSTLPNNILHLDLLALEFNLLHIAHNSGVANAPDRTQPLTSLSALLQTLHIPVPAFAPLGNAGNDAYYALLAFQKLVMAQTRIPDMLFTQPNPAPYLGMPFPGPMHGQFRHSLAMPFPHYPILPMPPPIHSPGGGGSSGGHSRQHSSSSAHRQGSEYAPPSFPLSPANSDRRRASGDSRSRARPRPASIGDPLNTQVMDSYRAVTSEASRAPSGGGGSAANSTPGSGSARLGGRKSMIRSNTVYWDQAEYADGEQGGVAPGGQGGPVGDRARRESMLKAPLAVSEHRTGTSSGSSEAGAQNRTLAPASAEAHSRGRSRGPRLSRGAIQTERLGHHSVSFDGRGVAPQLGAGNGSGGRDGSASAGNSPVNTFPRTGSLGSLGAIGVGPAARSASSVNIRPSGLSSSSLHADHPGAGAGRTDSNSTGTGSSSVTKPGSNSSGEVAGRATRGGGESSGAEVGTLVTVPTSGGSGGAGRGEAEGKKKKEGKEAKEKKKGKGPKEIAGALARFWVG